MIIIPAVDMMDRKVVQLVGGKPGSERIVLPDPPSVAKMWVERGAKYLHLVDLDRAFGRDSNIDYIRKIAGESGVPVQVGGGIRSSEDIEELLSAGADRVIVGTRAVKEPEWLADVAGSFPGKIILAMDTAGGRIVVKGWQEAADITLDGMFRIIDDMPLAAVLNTNVDVEGQGKGIDEKAAKDFIERCPHQVMASGGVTTLKDAEILAEAGAVGAVVGISVYTGTLEPWKWRTPWFVKR
ncbi:MAG: 1-(5-phosphoribosyl)-5-[(5-phosphoribosylamino)methylideneamino] imidazole-4-carboxamide isomerase [Candidatus Methanomethylophilaceae archaeon]